MFNIGACYEAMGKLDEARNYYDQAVKMKSNKKYIQARKRVRLEGERLGR